MAKLVTEEGLLELLSTQEPGASSIAIMTCLELFRETDLERAQLYSKIILYATRDWRPHATRGNFGEWTRAYGPELEWLWQRIIALWIETKEAEAEFLARKLLSALPRTFEDDLTKALKNVPLALQVGLPARLLRFVDSVKDTLGVHAFRPVCHAFINLATDHDLQRRIEETKGEKTRQLV